MAQFALVQRCNAVSDAPAASAEKDQVSKCSVGQLGVLLPSTALATTPSSTVDTEQVLGHISPVKVLEPIYKTMPPKSICFDLCHMPLCSGHTMISLHFQCQFSMHDITNQKAWFNLIAP